ncbi:MAG: energy transducer TonB [Bacteroidales bacterium]
MKLKKNPNKDIERNKVLFLSIGMSLSLLGVWAVFSASQEIKATVAFSDDNIETVELDIPQITREEMPERQAAPPPKPIFADIVVTKEDVPLIDIDVFDEPDVTDALNNLASRMPSSSDVIVAQDTVVDIPDQNPTFPGGVAALAAWLNKEVVYPADAQATEIEGRVVIEFVVRKDGTVRDAVVLRKVHPSLDNEALRVIDKMPNWKPGLQGGRAVNCRFRIPITFKLQR